MYRLLYQYPLQYIYIYIYILFIVYTLDSLTTDVRQVDGWAQIYAYILYLLTSGNNHDLPSQVGHVSCRVIRLLAEAE